ncbi:MAG: hypothetical protein AB7W28_04060 [Armatimonadota bacterium]
MGDQPSPREKWVWVELIGFDNESPDQGVQAYLDNAGFVPDVISLLLYNADFLHLHAGMGEDRALPFDCCSYGGHPFSYERARQDWTTYQLRDLVRKLHDHGVSVFLALFDLFVTDQWIGQHPELLHVNRNGTRIRSLCPWKRLSDGTWYEDFFAGKLGEVLDDYGFDGFHQADGYSHPRLPLYEGDYSDDMVDQFVAATGLELPGGLEEASGDAPQVIQERARWIWRYARRQWIDFYADRIARFCRKVVETAHARGRQVVPNNALTRDPFQALYRYGVDYKRVAEAGVDGFVIETVAPGVSLGAEHGAQANAHYNYLAMLLLMKSYLPDLDLHCLTSAHDVNEQWDVLRHGPTLLEREIYCNSNLYRWRHDGTLERCSAGPMVCLGDGLQRHEWQWLREWWGRGFSANPCRIVSATVVWSDKALSAQLDDFIATRCPSTHRLLYELMARGAPIYCAADVADAGIVQGPLLVLNPQHFPEDELRSVIDAAASPVIAIGSRAPALPPPSFEFQDTCGLYPLVCAVYGAAVRRDVNLEPVQAEGLPEDVRSITEPPTFVEELLFHPVSDSFLAACVEIIANCAGAVVVRIRPDVIRVQALELDDQVWRLLVGNDSHYYVVTELDVGRAIESLEVITSFPGQPPHFEGSRFGLRVPGKGVVVIDVTFRRP